MFIQHLQNIHALTLLNQPESSQSPPEDAMLPSTQLYPMSATKLSVGCSAPLLLSTKANNTDHSSFHSRQKGSLTSLEDFLKTGIRFVIWVPQPCRKVPFQLVRSEAVAKPSLDSVVGIWPHAPERQVVHSFSHNAKENLSFAFLEKVPVSLRRVLGRKPHWV